MVKITDHDALQKMCEVEQFNFLRTQEDSLGASDLQGTYVGALLSFISWQQNIIAEPDAAERAYMLKGTPSIVIYGTGGVTRYFIRGDGRVVFSRRHGSEKAQARAREIGFDVE